ncbi:MAG: sigma-70 family RNA polymerase sigma factor [Chroococcidiopsidaceae cyanobacterium CP_BM_RX_35]|nr:sigma-70 family RNA polymerase sigma factor [Chroococcidiopsidaceae cyanobacterium CP_BM_RX_35]
MTVSMNQEPPRHQGSSSSLTAQTTDEELVQIAGQSPSAYAELYRRYVSNVYRYLLVRVGSVQEAEDLTTQTFMAALQAINTYQGLGKFRSWLLAIARRKLADYFRQERATLPLEMAQQVPCPRSWLEEHLDQQLQMEQVAFVLQTLSSERAEALALRLFGQLTTAEVALVMGKTEAAVKMLVYRAIGDLQKRLHTNP